MVDRPQFIARLPRHSVGAEIGVWKGEFSAELLAVVEPELLVLIDPWEKNTDHTNYESTVNTTQERLDGIYEAVVERFRLAEGVEVIRARSLDVAARNTIEFDWVYDDSQHNEASVAANARAWWPHVKPGGYYCGHDFNLDGVRRAIERFAEAEGVAVEVVGDVNFMIQKPQIPHPPST
jgi:uncharacterized protein YndB with AHSA1/START domain